jgi:hypothetical protein
MAEKRFSQNRSFIFFEKLKFIHLRVKPFHKQYVLLE